MALGWRLSPLLLLSLPLFPTGLRLLWLLNLPSPYLTPDEIIYPQAGRAYLGSIMAGNLAGFKLNAEHPPLAKLILGLLLLMVDHQLSDIVVLRLLCAVFSSLTCVVLWFHLKRYGNGVALLGWLLLSTDLLSIRYSVALLDVVATTFLTLSMYLALSEHSNSPSKSAMLGVVSGLAVLSKYSALPILAGVCLLNRLVRQRTETTWNSIITLSCALVVVLVGNPMLWPPALLGYHGLEILLSSSSVYSTGPGIMFIFDWLGPLLEPVNQGLTGFYLSMFVFHLSIFPFRLFSESIVPWLLLACLCHRLKKREPLSHLQRSQIPWLLSCILFFWLLEKSRIETYYMVMMGPSMTVLTALMLPLPKQGKPC